jgi:hypothetical protein
MDFCEPREAIQYWVAARPFQNEIRQLLTLLDSNELLDEEPFIGIVSRGKPRNLRVSSSIFLAASE